MHNQTIHLLIPEIIYESAHRGTLASALESLASLAEAKMSVAIDKGDDALGQTKQATECRILFYHTKPVGRIFHAPVEKNSILDRAIGTMVFMLEHAIDRELSITSLADEMIGSYEELNMLYKLLPSMATGVHPGAIAEVLVEETMRTLQCQRVSLLVLNDSKTHLQVLASRGLPPKAQRLSIPVAGSVSGHALSADDSLIINKVSDHPELAAMSRGDYDSDAFAVVRVVLKAQGEPVGVLTATDRYGMAEFTARDQSLLEGLAAMGASALLNCRLHSTVNRQMVSTIRALASAIDAKDQYTHEHSARVAHLAVATARAIGIHDAELLREVELAGLLHDIGKIGISDKILSKEGRLTTEEFNIVKTHADIGARIVENVDGLERVAKAVRHHHERYDGLGYPSGLSGEQIPLTSRLITVTDVFDCLTSNRPYRSSIDVEQAISEINRSKDTQLDPKIVDAFLNIIRRELANGIMNMTPEEAISHPLPVSA